VQGVTEVAPVSSSAHLTLVPWLLGWPPAPDRTTFAAGLHAGSCLGIALALARSPAGPPPPRVAGLAAATCVPAAVAGLLAADTVEARLGRPEQLPVLLAGAGVLLALADSRPEDRTLGGREAAYAALAQVAALAPGVSRSGAALTALRAAGVGRAEAERFSLLMSLPVTAGAALLTLARSDRVQLRALAGPLAVGVPAAGLAGWAAARRRQRRGDHRLAVVAAYRLGIAAVVFCTSRRRRSRP
jgi:undecaprenyl-diphosphatase